MSDRLASIYTIAVEHVTIASTHAFDDVRRRLESRIPQLDHTIFERLQHGEKEAALRDLESGSTLSIFGSRNHGGLLMIVGLKRQAIQYEIGNPLTASKMTRLHILAGLYAPLRVLLRENGDGVVAFEYDRPVSLFGQFNDEGIDIVARQLDQDLQAALEDAAI